MRGFPRSGWVKRASMLKFVTWIGVGLVAAGVAAADEYGDITQLIRGGNPAQAIQSLQQAESLSPSVAAQAEGLIQQIRAGTLKVQ